MILNKVAISLVACLVLPQFSMEAAFCNSAKSNERIASADKSSQADETAIHSKINAIAECVGKADAKSLSMFWTPDGSFIDDSGSMFVGRAALEKNFASSFADKDHPQVTISVETLRIPATDVATVEGTVKRKEADGRSAPLSRYSMMLLRQSGDWLISSATETVIVADGASQDLPNPLAQLDWLIGQWHSEHDGASVTMKADWAPEKTFIHCKYEIKNPHFPTRTENHVIGWDARHAQPISWNFDSDGGFGQGNWTRRGNQWSVESAGFGRDGSVTTATNIYEPSDKNSFSWSSTNRGVDGFPVADTIPVKVNRVSN
jgi:uncharacterized protein (TIGR02246 family)